MNNHAVVSANVTGAQIPNYLRSQSDKFAGSGGLVGAAVPTPLSEVDRELSQLHMELGDLESVVTELGLRLKPVLHPNDEKGLNSATANCSSAVGQQVSASAYRVAGLSAQIRSLLSSLAV